MMLSELHALVVVSVTEAHHLRSILKYSVRDRPARLLFGSQVRLRKGKIIALPLLPVLLVIGVSTALLWYRDRRPPKGHCQNCDYDLTGNVSGVCPECGEPTPGAGD